MQLNNLNDKTQEDFIDDTKIFINNDEDNDKLQITSSKKEKESAKRIPDL